MCQPGISPENLSMQAVMCGLPMGSPSRFVHHEQVQRGMVNLDPFQHPCRARSGLGIPLVPSARGEKAPFLECVVRPLLECDDESFSDGAVQVVPQASGSDFHPQWR